MKWCPGKRKVEQRAKPDALKNSVPVKHSDRDGPVYPVNCWGLNRTISTGDYMKICIALFRGINVGGKNILPMKELVDILEALGARNVRTYIQSGNAIFQCHEVSFPQISAQIAAEIRKRRGFEPSVLILGLDDLEKAIAENPFPEGEADPSSLHLGFLASTPANPDLIKLDYLKKESERYRVSESVFYLHAPEGIGRSKLAAGVEKVLGVPMTDRNWNTVCKIREMAMSM